MPKRPDLFTQLGTAEAVVQASDEQLEVAKRLHLLVARLVTSTELHPLLDEVLDATIELQHADFGNVQLYRPETKTLEIVVQRGFDQEFLAHFASVDGSTSICGRAMLTRKRVIVEDIQDDPDFTPHLQVAAAAGFRAVQSTPLFNRQGDLLGMISTHFRQPHRPSDHDLELTDLYVGIASEMIRRMQAEQGVRESEERFRQLAENIKEVFWVTDASAANVLYASPPYEKIWGQSLASLYENGLSWLEAVHPDDRAQILRALDKLIQETSIFEEEYRIVQPDGSIRWIHDRGFPVRDEAGHVQSYVGIAEDITLRKSVEEALRASEERYREFFDHNLAGTFRTTPDGRILDCNESFARMLGYPSKEEILSHSAWDLYANRTEREVAIHRLLRQKVTANEEFFLQRKDGSSMWILANRTLNESEHPPVIEGTMMDITAQKRAEADVQSLFNVSKRLYSIRDAEELMDALIVEAVKLTAAEYGWSGMRTPEGMVCHKCFRDGEFIPYEYCWPAGVGWPGWVLVHKVPYATNDAQEDGIIVPEIREKFGVRSGIDTPLFDTGGEVIGFFEVNNKRNKSGFMESDVEKMVAVSQIASVALQNILSYQKIQRNEEELRQLSARLLRLQDEERKRLARELHDSTGQILATLLLKVGIARRSVGGDNEKTIAALADCSALAKRCSDDLRTLSYLLHPPPLDQEGLASALRWYVQGFTKRSGIRVDLNIPSSMGRLPEEVEAALFRVVQEALTNIHLHSESPTAWIKITLAASRVTLEIRDAGKGLPSEVLERVLRDLAPLGVGIAGMRERICQLGGTLEIGSGKGGTSVRAVLPVSGGTSS